MATREEVMATAERLIRRGELGDAAGLLEVWVRSHPGDEAASSKLASVREVADPAELRRVAAARSSAPPTVQHAPPLGATLPADPIEALQALLKRVQANRRR